MAIPEGPNIYDVVGTVLTCTIPIRSAATSSPHVADTLPGSAAHLSDAENTPLSYEAALAMQESADAPRSAYAVSRRSMNNAVFDTVVPATTRRASALTGANTFLPVPPPLPPRASDRGGGVAAALSARYGPLGGAAAATAASTAGVTSRTGGVASMKVGDAAAARRQQQQQKGPKSRNVGPGHAVDHGGVAGSEGGSHLESIPAQNALLAQLLSSPQLPRQTGLTAHAASSSPRNGYTGFTGVRNAATTGAAAAGSTFHSATSGSGATLTVAAALEMLFPITPVPEGSKHGGTGEGRAGGETTKAPGADGSAASPPPGISRKRMSAVDSTSMFDEKESIATSEPALPRLWRRAEVGHVSRLDVVLLYQHLQHRCTEESARARGVVCPNRERIYQDAWMELTRHVTLLCPERGLLMEELSRSLRQSTDTYDVLLDSASQYAVRKSTERDLHQHLFAEKAELEVEVRRREHRVSEWRAKYAGLQKRFEEQQAADAKLHEAEIAYAKNANAQLVSEVKRLASEAEKAKAT